MTLNLRTRRQLALLNAQDWADFKAHWPMRLLVFWRDLLIEFGGGFAFGFALSLAALLWLLERAP